MAFDKDSKYDRNKDVVFKRCSANPSGKKFFNVEVYSYDGGPTWTRIRQAAANSNPNAEENKKWINLPGISHLSKQETLALSKLLADAAQAPEL